MVNEEIYADLYEICDDIDDVWVSDYEYVDDDPTFRAFLFNISRYTVVIFKASIKVLFILACLP